MHSHNGTTHTHADQEPALSATVWTNDLELFMEYPVLRVGRPARFAVHLTKLKDFKPLTEGPVLFRFAKPGASPKLVTAGTPETAGIFGPTVTFDEAGDYRLTLEILTRELEATLEYGPIRVLAAAEEGPPPEGTPAGQTISYLKEQQWKLPFATATVARRSLHRTLRIPAEIKAKTGHESVVSATVAGRFLAPESGMPGLGQVIRQGQLLGYIELLPVDRSSLLDSRISAGVSLSRLMQDIAQAQAAVAAEEARLRLAEKEARRVRELVELEALPQRRLDEAESELAVRQAALQAAQQTLVTGRNALSRHEFSEQSLSSVDERLPLTAVVGGRLVECRAVPGQYVDARETLFRIVDLSVVWAEGMILERDLPALEDVQGATLHLPGLEPRSLQRDGLVLIGSTLHPASRTLPIVLEVDNADRRIKLGALGQLELQVGGSLTALAVPASAVLLEENRSVVYVQLGGETFERRMVKTGIQDGQWIEILDGVDEGERIVVEGAYDVALAGRSTEVPQHGHVH